MQDLAQRLYDEGRFDEAAGVCRDILMRHPRDLNAMHLLGLVHVRRHEAADAVPLLHAVAAARPDAGVMNDLGSVLAIVGRVDEAIARFRAALTLQPDCLPASINLGKVLLENGRAEEAVPILRQVLALEPDSPALRVQLANALLEQGNVLLADDQPREAECCYREAMTLRAQFSEAAANLGTALVAQNRLQEGIEFYRTALAWRPGYANTEFSLGLALLMGGAFAEGWRCFEARCDMPAKAATYRRRFDVPLCRSQDLLSLPAGSTVLLLAEQGLGDMIQYSRYVPLLVDHGVRVILEAQPELHALFRRMRGVTLIAPSDPSPSCDAACFLLSLPLTFATGLATVPANVPYLTATADRRVRWEAWLGASHGLRVGLAVSGDPAHPHDRSRSIALARLAPLFAVPDCTFLVTQRDVREADRAVIEATPGLRATGVALQDFADTAALLSHLDLLITVDTSVAHLAGALGLPVWLMLRFSPDYRWLLGRIDSPWYPTMRLYRQPSPGDWDAVIDAVGRDLSGLR